MRVTGITGGIGAGKSVVSRVLRTMGYSVYDCDQEARRLMDGSPALTAEMRERWGNEVISPENGICRPAVARIVFGSETERRWLDARVHSMVREDFRRWMELHREEGKVFVESAILISSGLGEMCGSVWVVEAPEDVRVERACLRSALSREEVRARIRAQKRELDGVSGVEVLENDGVTPLLGRIRRLLSEETV